MPHGAECRWGWGVLLWYLKSAGSAGGPRTASLAQLALDVCLSPSPDDSLGRASMIVSD